jgi:hypothetical protein
MLPYVMVVVLAKEERLGEVLDVGALLALATSDVNFHLVATLVDVELTPASHVVIGRCQNDLDGIH